PGVPAPPRGRSAARVRGPAGPAPVRTGTHVRAAPRSRLPAGGGLGSRLPAGLSIAPGQPGGLLLDRVGRQVVVLLDVDEGRRLAVVEAEPGDLPAEQ